MKRIRIRVGKTYRIDTRMDDGLIREILNAVDRVWGRHVTNLNFQLKEEPDGADPSSHQSP